MLPNFLRQDFKKSMTLESGDVFNSATRALLKGTDWLAQKPLLSGAVIAALSFLGSALFAAFAGISVPSCHDEFSFLLAGETFSKGHLSYPMHPLWEHFISFHTLVKPRYACGYGPIQGMFLALGFLAGHPIIGVWISVAVMCAAVYWMLRAWFTPRWALIGGLFCVAQLGIYTYWSQRYWGGAPAAIGGSLMLGGARHLCRKVRLLPSLFFALGIGILVNSRPFEGLVAGLVACSILLTGILQKKFLIPEFLRKGFVPFAVILISAAAWTCYYNKSLTGNPFTLPQSFLAQSESSVPFFTWQGLGPSVTYTHRVMQDFEEGFARHHFFLQQSSRGFFMAKTTALQNYQTFYAGFLGTVLLLLTFFRLWKFREPRMIILTLLTFFAVTIFPLVVQPQRHYLAPMAGMVIVLFTYSMRCIVNLRWGVRKIGPWLVVLFLAVSAVPRADTILPYTVPASTEGRAALIDQFKKMGGEHLMIVRYLGAFEHQHFEWVYNGADIDHQPVVWARAMDEAHNRRLIDYYKERNIWILTVDGGGNPSLQPFKVSPEFSFFEPPF